MDVTVRFDEKDATVRYLPSKVSLDQIIQRYKDTPFGVVPAGPVTTIAQMKHGVIRGWSKRMKADGDKPQLIHLFVESASKLKLSLADPPTSQLELLEEFRKGDREGQFVAKLYERVALSPGEITVPVSLEMNEREKADPANQLAIVVRTPPKPSVQSKDNATGVALIGGAFELRLGHLCNQKGCVDHFHQSLIKIGGLAAVNPHPSLKSPGATVYLRAGQPVDIWKLRESLRDQSVEIVGLKPRDLGDYRLRVELPRWTLNETIQQCMDCRERVVEVIEHLDWTANVSIAGGGINFGPNDSDTDLVKLLDAITGSGAAPAAVWFVPAGVSMPKSAKPLEAYARTKPKSGGSLVHPIVEFELNHTCDLETNITSLFHRQKWASETHADTGDKTRLAALIADRKFAGLTPLLRDLRSSGHTPRAIRLREFGDIRIQLEFAHICGDVIYSKPPKRKKKKKGDAKKKESKKDEKPKKPFVAQPVKMADSSNGHKAIKTAIESVSWVKNGLFYDYHTKFQFRGGPRKITFALQAIGDDVVRLDELTDALCTAGFPPKSVVVSRRFPGIPFGKPFPDDLPLTNRNGETVPLDSFKKQERPLVVAFICLKTKSRKYGKNKADPKLYERLGKTITTYQDRVDIVAISANKHDEFADVAEFWDKTGLDVPLLHDANGVARAVFNMQVTPPPHMFVFDADGRLRYGGDAHSHWEKPNEKHEDYLGKAIDLVIAKKFLKNGAVFYNKSVCNCSHPKCKCPKCGCGSTCCCGIKHCSVGF